METLAAMNPPFKARNPGASDKGWLFTSEAGTRDTTILGSSRGPVTNRGFSGPRGWRCTLLLLALTLMGLLRSASLATAGATTSLTLTPTTVTIEADTTAMVVVSSDGGGSPPVLRVLDPPGVTSKILHTPPVRPGPQLLNWLVELKADPALLSERLVSFELLRNGQPLAISQVKVTPKAAPTVATSVKADLLVDGLEGCRAAEA